MPEESPSSSAISRVRFAPSPTGYLHVGSARTFIFNWLFARHTGGAMVLRLDDTDVERNSDASVQSIFEGLRWLGLDWDEEYKQSERLDLHRKAAQVIFDKGLAYRDFTPAHAGDEGPSSAQGAWLFNPGMREMSGEESDRRAAAGEPFALRYRVPRGIDRRQVHDWLQAQPGVAAVHHLHIWSLGAGEIAMTAHLVRPEAGDHDAFIDAVSEALDERFGINHPTLQIERGLDSRHDCADRAPHGDHHHRHRHA